MNDALRDQFAMAALPAIINIGVSMSQFAAQSGNEHNPKFVDHEQWAATAYVVADAMMKAREQ